MATPQIKIGEEAKNDWLEEALKRDREYEIIRERAYQQIRESPDAKKCEMIETCLAWREDEKGNPYHPGYCYHGYG